MSSRVITGMRFINVSNCLRIEIQQGKLGPYGVINTDSVQWKESRVIYSLPSIIKLWRYSRGINLNTVSTVPPEMAMIGWYCNKIHVKEIQ